MEGRDPYLGLLSELRQDASARARPGVCIGTVLSPFPGLTIRAGGLELSGDDLRVCRHLLLPEREFCIQTGLVTVVDKVPYPVSSEFNLSIPEAALAKGDEVLLIPSDDQQVYYVVDKVVTV